MTNAHQGVSARSSSRIGIIYKTLLPDLPLSLRGVVGAYNPPFRITILSVSLILGLAHAAEAQSMRCGAAVQQLQAYAQQVNYVANVEYYQGIPMKCGMNTMCQYQLLSQLNQWYMQQAGMVNNWYRQIAMTCASGSVGDLGNEEQGTDHPGKIDESGIEDLTIDDADKTVRIRIPKTPSGFRK